MRNYSRLPEPDQLELEQVAQSRKAEQLQQLYFTHHHRTKAISLAEAQEVLAPLSYDLDQAIAKMGLPPRPKRVVAPSVEGLATPGANDVPVGQRHPQP